MLNIFSIIIHLCIYYSNFVAVVAQWRYSACRKMNSLIYNFRVTRKESKDKKSVYSLICFYRGLSKKRLQFSCKIYHIYYILF